MFVLTLDILFHCVGMLFWMAQNYGNRWFLAKLQTKTAKFAVSWFEQILIVSLYINDCISRIIKRNVFLE
jgi:hypothetical protein